MTSCSLVDRDQFFWRPCCLCLQGVAVLPDTLIPICWTTEWYITAGQYLELLIYFHITNTLDTAVTPTRGRGIFVCAWMTKQPTVKRFTLNIMMHTDVCRNQQVSTCTWLNLYCMDTLHWPVTKLQNFMRKMSVCWTACSRYYQYVDFDVSNKKIIF